MLTLWKFRDEVNEFISVLRNGCGSTSDAPLSEVNDPFGLSVKVVRVSCVSYITLQQAFSSNGYKLHQ